MVCTQDRVWHPQLALRRQIVSFSTGYMALRGPQRAGTAALTLLGWPSERPPKGASSAAGRAGHNLSCIVIAFTFCICSQIPTHPYAQLAQAIVYMHAYASWAHDTVIELQAGYNMASTGFAISLLGRHPHMHLCRSSSPCLGTKKAASAYRRV